MLGFSRPYYFSSLHETHVLIIVCAYSNGKALPEGVFNFSFKRTPLILLLVEKSSGSWLKISLCE